MQTIDKVLGTLVGSATVLTVSAMTSMGVQPAQAASLTFDLTGSNANAPSFMFTVDDVTLTATGSNEYGARDLRRTQYGLGVRSADGEDSGPHNQIDGRGSNGLFGPEALLLELDRKVKIISAVFSRVNRNDNFHLLIDGNHAFAGDIPGPPMGSSVSDHEEFIFTAPVNSTVGTKFTFTVPQMNDDYALKSVTFEAVPEPATLLGMLAIAATAGVAVQRKEQKSA
ncbi:MAG: PEP-CTERM sorting domain-containing protein [Cyanobacteria bacterium]|nr:PEP-CTERM sorting domain-containing protein [Cyanobacteriota bacterium]